MARSFRGVELGLWDSAETALATVFDIGRSLEGSFTISTPSNELNLVIFADGSVKDVIRSFTAHVGRPPIPPCGRSGFGSWPWEGARRSG